MSAPATPAASRPQPPQQSELEASGEDAAAAKATTTTAAAASRRSRALVVPTLPRPSNERAAQLTVRNARLRERLREAAYVPQTLPKDFKLAALATAAASAVTPLPMSPLPEPSPVHNGGPVASPGAAAGATLPRDFTVLKLADAPEEQPKEENNCILS